MKAYTVKSKTDNVTFNVEEYGSSMELVENNKRRPVTKQWEGRSLDKREIHKSWYGVDSYDEALNLLYDGWTEGLDKVKTTVKNVATQNNGKRITFKNNVMGFAPIVPLAMMNVPNAMIDTAIKPIKSKVIRIIYNISVHSGTSTETLLNNGMKVLKAIITLENSGYRCEIISFQSHYDCGICDTLMLKVKDANQPLDLKRIMFPLIHPAMFRVIGFDWEDKYPNSTHMYGRGTPLGSIFGSRTATIVKEAFGDNCVFLDGENLKSMSDEDVKNLITGKD